MTVTKEPVDIVREQDPKMIGVAGRVHKKGDTLLRTEATYARYHNNPKRKATECFICTAVPTRNYKYWAVILNDFPYDAVAEAHAMLVPKRHIANANQLTAQELKELDMVKFDLNSQGFYDAMMENFITGRTFLPHYHLHLLKWIRV